MRYQQYKNRMLKIRKVIDFFYRFRFVFAGAITAIVAASITLDVTRGNITETTEFKIAYQYGEEIECSGSAFMGNVTYEFRRKGDTEWSEEKPIYPGQYEARAKSKGNHGYKYSEETSFTITPYHSLFEIKGSSVNFGDDSPELSYDLLPGDHLNEDYIVEYADKTKTKTTASININSLKIYNSDNVDVTACYSITTVPQEVEFIPEKLTFTFINPNPFIYTGDQSNPFSANECNISGSIYYDAEPVITGDQIVDITRSGAVTNHHQIAIRDKQGNDYTNNYQITIKENKYTVNKAPAIVITSPTLSKRYNDEPFAESSFTLENLEVENLLSIHEITDVVFAKKDAKTCAESGDNTFTYNIRDKSTHEIIDPTDFYQGTGVIVHPGKININKIPVTINTKTINHTFDNTEVKGYVEGVDEVDYTVNDGDGKLFGDDFIKVDSFKSYTNPGKYTNEYTCHVYRQMMVGSVLQDVDVTSNYDIKYSNGNINIQVEPIVIKFDGREVEYNGGPQNVYQNDNYGSIISGSFPTGWTYSARVYNNVTELNAFTMTNALADDKRYSANEEQVVLMIWDDLGNPVQDTLSPSSDDIYKVDTNKSHDNDSQCDITFVFEESRITKASLAVTLTDFDPLDYNRQTLEERLNLQSRVSSVGLKGDDEVVVSFSDNSQKAIKDAKATPYSLGINVEVYNSLNHQPTGSNYIITCNGIPLDGPVYSQVTINRKKVTIHTPDIDMVYSDSTVIPNKEIDFSSVQVLDEYGNPIDGLEVTYNTNKVYTAISADVGARPYTSFEDTDIIIKDKTTHEILHQNGVLDNYNITLIEDGQLEITPRLLEIYQVDDETKDHIFYDGLNHGVFNGSNEIEYTHEDNNQEIGLLESKEHTLNIANGKYKDTANGPGDAATYGYGVADKIAYYGISILKGGNDVTSNYDIQFPDDYIYINIIKKKIDITSGSSKKVFDGIVFDLYSGYEADQWIDIDQMKAAQFTYTVTRYDEKTGTYVNANLDDGDKVQVKKTKQSILNDSKNVGSHTNEFEWRIVDKNGATKANDFYNVSEHYGSLEVKKLYIDFSIDHREKEYDSNNITFPDGELIDSGVDGYQCIVNENSREKGILLEYRTVYDLTGPDPTKIIAFDKDTFESNFKVVARIYKGSYPKFYLAGDYEFSIQTFIYYSDLNYIYNETSNVEMSFNNATLNYKVTKPRIELKRTMVTTTLELRILVGTLRANDTLYFGTEKFTTQLGKKPRVWESEFSRANVHIYRNDNIGDEVTDCYTIVM